MTASVTRDPKRAKIRKYWPREELGSSASVFLDRGVLGVCYDFKRFRQLSTAVGSKV